MNASATEYSSLAGIFIESSVIASIPRILYIYENFVASSSPTNPHESYDLLWTSDLVNGGAVNITITMRDSVSDSLSIQSISPILVILRLVYNSAFKSTTGPKALSSIKFNVPNRDPVLTVVIGGESEDVSEI